MKIHTILSILLITLILTGCNLQKSSPIDDINARLESTKQDLEQAKINLNTKVDQAKQVQTELNELSEAWNKLKN